MTSIKIILFTSRKELWHCSFLFDIFYFLLSLIIIYNRHLIFYIDKHIELVYNNIVVLLWLSRQSTSLVRTRSPVRSRLAAPQQRRSAIRPTFICMSGRVFLYSKKAQHSITLCQAFFRSLIPKRCFLSGNKYKVTTKP